MINSGPCQCGPGEVAESTMDSDGLVAKAIVQGVLRGPILCLILLFGYTMYGEAGYEDQLLQSVYVKEGDRVTLYCPGTQRPPEDSTYSFRWFQENIEDVESGPLVAYYKKIKENKTGTAETRGIWEDRVSISPNDGSVTIGEVMETDEHQYICSVTGWRDAIVHLQIIVPSRLYMDITSGGGKENDTLTAVCYADPVKPRQRDIFWHFCGNSSHQLRGEVSEKVIDESKGTLGVTSKLSYSLRLEDDGRELCCTLVLADGSSLEKARRIIVYPMVDRPGLNITLPDINIDIVSTVASGGSLGLALLLVLLILLAAKMFNGNSTTKKNKKGTSSERKNDDATSDDADHLTEGEVVNPDAKHADVHLIFGI